MAKTYLDVYREHSGFVSNKWIHYFFIYDRIFSNILEKGKPIKMLEIGVQNGGSLEIWKKYLPQNSEIYGVDVDEKCTLLKFSEGISFHLGSAVDRDFIEKTFGDIQFDLILDDGSHICNEVIQAFEYLWPKIKNGGRYVVEDICTSYWKKYGGGLNNEKSSIEYFKKLIDSGLNKDHLRCNLVYDINPAISNAISQISFFDSICVIDKFYGLKDEPFKNARIGEIALVAPEVIDVVPEVNNKQSEIDTTEKLFCDGY
jgi:cephalosporin hydroxylase